MKKYGFLFLVIVLCLITSCSKSSNDDPTPTIIDKSPNLLGTGDSAHDILANDTFDKLLIEAAYVQNFKPSAEAMDNFVTFLTERTFKEDIEILYRELNSPNEDDLTLQELADLEEENRLEYNNGSTMAIYIYFADAPSEDDDEEEALVTLGTVYRNTSMVIYEKTVRELAGQSSQITEADVESATLNHEFGHLFGLVDLGTPQVNDHEDPDAINHCNVPGCLMRAELQFGGGLMSMLESRVSKGLIMAPGLDDECILDLQNNGGR